LGVNKFLVKERLNAQLFKYFAPSQSALDKLLEMSIIHTIDLL